MKRTKVQKVPPTTTEVISVPASTVPLRFTPSGEDPNRILSLVEYAVKDKRSMEDITKLTDLYLKLMDKQAERSFTIAMSEFKRLCPVIHKTGVAKMKFKDRNGDQTTKENKFPELSEICRIINPSCQEVGLTYDWDLQQSDRIEVSCIVSHVGGFKKRVTLKALADESGGKNAIQAIGSTQTYLERYTLLAAFGLAAQEDTDGNTSGNDSMESSGTDLIKMTEADFNRLLPTVRKGIVTVEALQGKFTMSDEQVKAFKKVVEESKPQQA